MSLKALTQEQVDQIRGDLRELGVEGLPLLNIPAFEQDADSHKYVRDVMMAFLRSMFRSMEEDSGYRWDSEDSKAGVTIDYADPRADQERGKTPHISVELGPFSWGNHAINNFLGGRADGESLHTDLRNGSIIIRCRSSTKLESDSLAAVISGAIKYMRQDIQQNTSIHWIDAAVSNPSSSELQQTSPSGEFFVSNVVANVHYQETWKKPSVDRIRDKVVFVQEPEGVFLD